MRILKMVAATFVGMMVLAGGASAQTYNIVANAVTSTGASGTYNVVLVLSGTNYTITSKGVNDGVTSGVGAKHTVDQMSFTFAGATPSESPTSTSGAVTAGTDASGTATAGSLTSGTFGSTVTYGTPSASPAFDLLAFGGNTFTATGTLSQPFSFGTFKVALQDDGQQWNNSINITPESTSSLLMVAGLIPFGLLAWRKSRGKAFGTTA